MNKSKYNPVILSRNKIISIGKKIPSVRIEQRLIKTDETLFDWDVYKTIRRKNKIFCYTDSGNRLDMIFKNIKYAKLFKKRFKDAMLKEVEIKND